MSSPEDLTVDACPSYPENKDQPEEKTASNNNDNKRNELPKSAKLKTNTPPSPSAYASVINISNSNGIHIGSNYNVFINKSDTAQQKREIVITDAIKNLFVNISPVNKEHLNFISSHIGEGWRDTARILNFSDGQINQFYESNIHSGLKEVIYQILLDWIQNEVDAATIGKLSSALWKSNQKDVVLKWSEIFSKRK